MMYEQEKQVAIAAVVSAATLCEQVRRQYPADAMEKRDHSPVTIADFGTQACHLSGDRPYPYRRDKGRRDRPRQG